MKLGIYGGTFDPPHLGHLVVAQEALHQLGLDRLLFVPAAVPPHKRDRGITDGRIRLEMLRAAVAGVPGFEVSELELERDGPSYTADTLRQLGEAHPGAGLYLVLGADQANELHTWREPDVIHKLARLVVFRRAGEHPEIRPGDGEPPLEIEVPRLDLSSTIIRRRVRDREPIRFLVPDAVREVVERQGLYREG
ncbi:MAG TPA: nicotinate-nucleotide adenylyltransferase [Longimicrobiales bacterium]|nr:nicotinate-nucleotide adenylyltransferase [Longimicrobiales bacterium]